MQSVQRRVRKLAGRSYRSIRHLVFPPFINETLYLWVNLGYFPHLRSPRTFNEKIAHRKLFTREATFAALADKWAVRDYVSDRVGSQYLPILYQHAVNPNEINLSELPDAFVIKGRHDWGSTTIIDDKSAIDWTNLINRYEASIRQKYGRHSYEYWYLDIPPGILVEERLTDEVNDVPMDYKLFVFHGQVKFIQVMQGRGQRLMHRFYNPNWTPVNVKRPHSELAPIMARPRQLSTMISVAEELSKGMDFVRVDLYAPNDERVIFGEFTFAPAAGRRPFQPTEFDLELGQCW